MYSAKSLISTQITPCLNQLTDERHIALVDGLLHELGVQLIVGGSKALDGVGAAGEEARLDAVDGAVGDAVHALAELDEEQAVVAESLGVQLGDKGGVGPMHCGIGAPRARLVVDEEARLVRIERRDSTRHVSAEREHGLKAGHARRRRLDARVRQVEVPIRLLVLLLELLQQPHDLLVDEKGGSIGVAELAAYRLQVRQRALVREHDERRLAAAQQVRHVREPHRVRVAERTVAAQVEVGRHHGRVRALERAECDALALEEACAFVCAWHYLASYASRGASSAATTTRVR